jgi:hypothetical protein
MNKNELKKMEIKSAEVVGIILLIAIFVFLGLRNCGRY